MNEVVKLAIDTYNGKVAGEYTESKSMDVLRKALIDANNGSTTLDYRAIRDGKCNGLFAIVEEIITKTVIDGLPDSSPIMQLVDFRNLAYGDMQTFFIEDEGNFVVAEVAEGTQGIRKQRMIGGSSVEIKPTVHAVSIYEELARVLSGRIDFNKMIGNVGNSFRKQINDDIYTAFGGIFSELSAPYSDSGSYSEDDLITMIGHVEAANDANAIVLGTKAGLRKLGTSVVADSAKEDIYNIGYFGKFNGTPTMALRQYHATGTDTFLLSDNDIWVVTGSMKPIKFVTEGQTLMIAGDPTSNQNLIQTFTTIHKYGVGVVINEKFGIYRIA